MRFLRCLWIRLTYWTVPCEGCRGTGICTGARAIYPHSCCGDCKRVRVPIATVPVGFEGSTDDQTALIGDGVMWRRPWSKRQVLRPEVK